MSIQRQRQHQTQNTKRRQTKPKTQKTKKMSNTNSMKKTLVNPCVREGWAVPISYQSHAVLPILSSHVKVLSVIINKCTLQCYIIKKLEFSIGNIFVMFAGCVGIPMGTLLVDLFLYSHEADFIQGLIKKRKKAIPIVWMNQGAPKG